MPVGPILVVGKSGKLARCLLDSAAGNGVRNRGGRSFAAPLRMMNPHHLGLSFPVSVRVGEQDFVGPIERTIFNAAGVMAVGVAENP
jgi:hypothetical protein